MGGKSSRDKGNRGELELMHLLHGARIRGRILTARKVSRAGYSETDLMVGERCSCCRGLGNLSVVMVDGPSSACSPCPLCRGSRIQPDTEEMVEVKRRRDGFKKIYEYLQDNFAVVFRADRKEWVICLRLTDLIEPVK